MPKIIKTDLTKLLRKQKGCSFLPHSVFSLKHRTISVSEMYGICSNIAFCKLYQLVWRIMAAYLPVVVRLKRTSFDEAKIFCLIIRQLREMGIKAW